MNVLELKRMLNRVIGDGPWRLLPMAEIIRLECAEHLPIHRPETTTGVLFAETSGWVHYNKQIPGGYDLNPNPRYSTRPAIFPEPTRTAYSLEMGTAIGCDGLVFHPPSRAIVLETAKSWSSSCSDLPILSAPGFPSKTSLGGIGLSAATLSGDSFYHFLFESISRLLFMKELLPHVDHIFINGPESSWKRNWLDQFGIDLEKIVWMDALSHYGCDQLLFCSHLVADCQPGTWLLTNLRKALGVACNEKPRKCVWAKRQKGGERSPAWEESLSELLPNFEFIDFSELSPADALSLCSETAVLAGAHGAGMCNIAFCPKGIQVLEVFPDSSPKYEYQRLTQLAGGHYTSRVERFDASAPNEQLVETIRALEKSHG